MKMHPSPIPLTALALQLTVKGKEWSYVFMGHNLYVRPPAKNKTYEASWEEVTGMPMRLGRLPSPTIEQITAFIETLEI